MGMNIKNDGGEPEEIVDINTTPLIDVMLVLLIMLIITIPIQTHAVKLNMPTNKSASKNDTPPEVVQIDIDTQGAIYWNGVAISSRQDLEERITSAAMKNPQPEVHLRPEKTAKYSQVALVMASTQRLGLKKLGLVGSEQFAD